jgi:ABC-type phosphate/phosphonate transport system substrate-binding protein
MTAIAALPMYDFPELAWSHDALWSFIADHLRSAGVNDVPEALDRDLAYNVTWVQPGLLLGQSCGLPIVADLDGIVRVVGGFAVTDGDGEARYSSALVVRSDSPYTDIGELPWPKVRVAINGWDSLSGYVSLGAACANAVANGQLPQSARFGEVRVSGAHVISAAMLRNGEVDLACLDGHTLALLSLQRPEAVEGLRIIGRGPTIPCLPLITNLSSTDHVVDALTGALEAAGTRTSLNDVRDALGITGFVAFGNERYEPIRELFTSAKQFFGQ